MALEAGGRVARHCAIKSKAIACFILYKSLIIVYSTMKVMKCNKIVVGIPNGTQSVGSYNPENHLGRNNNSYNPKRG